MTAGRAPPLPPPALEAELRQRVAEETLFFSYASDLQPVVDLYRAGFENAFASYRKLRGVSNQPAGTTIFWGNLGWGDAEGRVVASAIQYVGEHCLMDDGSVEVDLRGNKFSRAVQADCL